MSSLISSVMEYRMLSTYLIYEIIRRPLGYVIVTINIDVHLTDFSNITIVMVRLGNKTKANYDNITHIIIFDVVPTR